MKIEPQGNPIGGGATDRRCFSSLMNYVWASFRSMGVPGQIRWQSFDGALEFPAAPLTLSEGSVWMKFPQSRS